MHVFLYGTLRDAVLRARLLGRQPDFCVGTLSDYVVLKQATSALPALVERPGGMTEGELLLDVSDADLARLDSYELPFDYNRISCHVNVAGAQLPAQVYLPTAGVAVSDVPWDMAAWDRQSGEITREMMIEIGHYDPPLDGAELARQWHMIALRAGVRLRARADKTPASMRYVPQAGDVEIVKQLPLQGGFFKLNGFDVEHKTFRDKTAGPLRREVLVACDAAIVLPYDPKTDCVLLVEQMRMGPLIRGVPNPWVLEPVAGMVDGGETPLQAARRETMEEARLTDFSLEAMFSFYPSPGASTDYFYCYIALGDLPEPTTYLGGLVDEDEDLRLHILPFETAMALIDTGEVNVGPLIAMLMWLARHRDRLQAAA